MSHKPLVRARFQEFLLVVDLDLAEKSRVGGCPHCSGPLHRADYPRKPRGLRRGLGGRHRRRLSFCCGLEGCRKRTTPPSVRFLAGFVYVAALVVLLSAVSHGITPSRSRKLQAAVGVDRRTLARWRSWWQKDFPDTPFWKTARPRLAQAPADEDLPGGLLGSFVGTLRQRLLCLLRFLAPFRSSTDRAFPGT